MKLQKDRFKGKYAKIHSTNIGRKFFRVERNVETRAGFVLSRRYRRTMTLILMPLIITAISENVTLDSTPSPSPPHDLILKRASSSNTDVLYY